jgi:hypothetical protein
VRGDTVKAVRVRGVLILALFGALITVASCGGGSSSSSGSGNNTVVTSGQNILAISVNGGPVATQLYPNGAFASATICAPGSTTNCTTIDGLLVDTGSVGLRILGSALTTTLSQQTGAGGNVIANCVQYGDGSFNWGPVETADVTLGGEKASAIPIQVIENTQAPVPDACSNGFSNENTQQTLGANGILGVGPYTQDCGQACAISNGNPGFYFSCSSTSCQVANEATAQQLQNPVSMFSTDNNGVIIELPAVSGTATTVSGSLVFGIGTQSNNALGSAKVFTLDDSGYFSTTFNSQTDSQSFIDSGSNGYFFADSSITQCGSSSQGFYCPPTPLNLSATNKGANGASGAINFSVGDADTLFSSGNNAAAYGTLAGPQLPDASGSFDWGLPFFYGRNVFTAIQSQSTPAGSGPYWAY